MVKYYEVTLLLFDKPDADNNPVFEFKNQSEAIELVAIFIAQGYGAKVEIDFMDN